MVVVKLAVKGVRDSFRIGAKVAVVRLAVVGVTEIFPAAAGAWIISGSNHPLILTPSPYQTKLKG